MLTVLLLLASALQAQPIPDKDFEYKLKQKAYLPATGPRVVIDEGHNNLHKKEEGLYVLTRLLEADGYQLKSNTGTIEETVLEATDIYVIVNPLHPSDIGNWVVPNPSAFAEEEINTLVNWVKAGGKLLLVADHMPYGGAVQDLGKALGVEWNNGFAMRNGNNWPPSTFSRNDGTLKATAITDGKEDFERLTNIASFTGSVFKAPAEAEVFMEFDESHNVLMPDTAWQFSASTKAMSAKGWHQGASFTLEKGKVVVLGEAAMITAQVVNDNFKVGINSPQAPQNAQMALNIFHYLSDLESYIQLDDLLDNKLRAMEKAFKAGDMKTLAAFYSDEAQILAPSGNDAVGRKAVDEYWQALSGLQIDWELKTMSREVIGDQVHEIGTSKLTYKSNGNPVVSLTRFYMVWKLVDGQYLIDKDFYHGY